MAYASAKEQIKSGVVINPDTECWEWQRFVDRYGYGMVGRSNKTHRAHRVSYEAFRGVIPEGLTVDHLCMNRRCVNPDHLECVTHVDNTKRAAAARRKEECSHGHPLSGDNLYVYKNRRFCRTCNRIYMKKSLNKRALKVSEVLNEG